MAKYIVRRITYYFLQTIVHAILFAGLSWQITQISINFFFFDIVTDIKVIMPEYETSEKFINVCFDNYEIIDHQKFEIYLRSKYFKFDDEEDRKSFLMYNMSFKSRFDLISGAKLVELNRFGRSPQAPTRTFIKSELVCHNKVDDARFKFSAFLDNHNITNIWFGYSKKYPDIKTERFHWIEALDKLPSAVVQIMSSSSVFNHRLPFPYTDSCTKSGYENMNECVNKKYVAGFNTVYKNKLIDRNDGKYINVTMSSSESIPISCRRLHNCEDTTVFTYSRRQPSPYKKRERSIVGTGHRPSNTVSLIILSKPRIDNIDYVTYILGALGSWIGFSFIQLNQINKFFVTGDQISRDSIRHVSKLDFLKYKLVQQNDIKNVKHLLHIMCGQLKSEFNELVNPD